MLSIIFACLKSFCPSNPRSDYLVYILYRDADMDTKHCRSPEEQRRGVFTHSLLVTSLSYYLPAHVAYEYN